jgi:hypothetical protein
MNVLRLICISLCNTCKQHKVWVTYSVKKRWSYPCSRPWRPIGLCDVEALTLSRQSAHRWRWYCQPYAPAALYPQEDSWYSFLLEAESIPVPKCGRKDYINWKIQWPHWESNPQPSGLRVRFPTILYRLILLANTNTAFFYTRLKVLTAAKVTSWTSGIWNHVVLEVDTDVSEEHATSIFDAARWR